MKARRDFPISKTMYNMSVTNCAIIVRKRIVIDTLTFD